MALIMNIYIKIIAQRGYKMPGKELCSCAAVQKKGEEFEVCSFFSQFKNYGHNCIGDSKWIRHLKTAFKGILQLWGIVSLWVRVSF